MEHNSLLVYYLNTYYRLFIDLSLILNIHIIANRIWINIEFVICLCVIDIKSSLANTWHIIIEPNPTGCVPMI